MYAMYNHGTNRLWSKIKRQFGGNLFGLDWDVNKFLLAVNVNIMSNLKLREVLSPTPLVPKDWVTQNIMKGEDKLTLTNLGWGVLQLTFVLMTINTWVWVTITP